MTSQAGFDHNVVCLRGKISSKNEQYYIYLLTILMTSQAGFDHNVISTCQNFIEEIEQYYILLHSYLLSLVVVSMGRGHATNDVTSWF